eukprot:scaffold199258_cov37-Tisochrysis_lutea.AAC.2
MAPLMIDEIRSSVFFADCGVVLRLRASARIKATLPELHGTTDNPRYVLIPSCAPCTGNT